MRYQEKKSGSRRALGVLGALVLYGLLVVLLVAILLLPPISVAERILGFGYTSIPSEEGGFVNAEDGAQVTIPREGVQGRTRVRFTAIPRSSFLQGAAGDDLVRAAETIPLWLIMKSPYYRIQFRGPEPPSQVMVRLPMPGDAQPFGTLDLYTWNGESWEWLPHFIEPGDEYIEAQLDFLPQSVVVMQTKSLQPSVSADLPLSLDIPEPARDRRFDINLVGLYLDAGGAIRGDPGALPRPDQVAGYRVLPTLRNWEDEGAVRSDLVDNMLADASTREEHVRRIVEQVVGNGYPAVDIDYRGINPDLRSEYAAFVTELADVLHEQGKQISVRLEPPAQIAADRWDTGGYDWRAIGAAADAVNIPVLSDPKAYERGGQMDTMLRWAVGEVDRAKLGLVVSTRSREWVNGAPRALPYIEALAPLGNVTIEGGSTLVAPGQTVAFSLAGLGQAAGYQFEPNSGTYWLTYVSHDGQQHVIWLENGASIARKLGYVAEYNLRGVVVRDLLGEENDSQVWKVVLLFANLVIPPVESQLYVVWEVRSTSGDVLAQGSTELANPRYAWTAPQTGGEYTVSAVVSSDGGATGVARGSLTVLVTTP